MKALIYDITLNEPALLTRLEGDPNSATSYDFLPGSVLRGMVIARYTQHLAKTKQHTGHALDLDAEVRRLFFDGTTRYLNGYPLIDQQRSLPLPRAWHRQKTPATNATHWRDFAKEGPSPDEQKEQWKRAHNAFWVTNKDAGTMKRRVPLHHISIHTQRERAAGRPRQNSGAVFRYDALAANQIFRAVILCEDADAEFLKTLIGGTALASVGGSRNAGYGRVTLKFIDEVDEKKAWQETPAEPTPVAKPRTNGKLKITLLSDVLIRDTNGQFATDSPALAQFINTRLGIAGTIEKDLSFTSINVVGGFNRKWGLPLPQAPVFEAGSVLTLTFTKTPADLAQKIAVLEQSGIGERRAEGFGRVTVDWLDLKQWAEVKEKSSPPPDDKKDKPNKPLPDDSPDKRLAQAMANRLNEQRMGEIIKSRAAKITLSHPPNKSQISQLRELLQAAHQNPPDPKKDAISELQEHLSHVNDRSVTRRQFERARIGIEKVEEQEKPAAQKDSAPASEKAGSNTDSKPKKLDQWLLTDVLGCDSDDKLAALLGMKATALPAVNIAGVSAVRNATDYRRYALLLALEVMRRVNKARQDGEA